MLSFIPHPLTTLIVNTEHRIRLCLHSLNDTELTSSFDELASVLDNLVSSEDFEIDWEFCGASAAARFVANVERARIAAGWASFELTTAEAMFFAQAQLALEDFKTRLRTAWARVEKRAAGAAEEQRTSNDKKEGAQNLWDYIKQVEESLRIVAERAYRTKFASRWSDEIARAIGREALVDAQGRLTRESASQEDIIHFLSVSLPLKIGIRQAHSSARHAKKRSTRCSMSG